MFHLCFERKNDCHLFTNKQVLHHLLEITK